MSHGALKGVVVFRRNAEGVRPRLLAYSPLGFVCLQENGSKAHSIMKVGT